MRERRRAWRRRAAAAGLLGALPVAACFGPAPTPVPELPAPPATPSAPVPPPSCERIVGIEVSKAERRLRARCERGARIEMTAALGRRRGPKRASGDERTPEGSYRVSGTPRASRFHLFIPIDYPSLADADTALADGRLPLRDYARIRRAHEGGAAPPGDSPLGGAVGIHGEGARWRGDSEHLDWTHGCVAVSDAEIEFLAERLEVGTPVVIGP